MRWYEIDPDLVVPSVTTVIRWGGVSVDYQRFVDPEVLAKAINRGNRAHSHAEALAQGLPPALDEGGHVESLERWWDIAKPEVVCSEQRVFSRTGRVAGRKDLLAVIHGDSLAFIDIKSGKPQAADLQLSAYQDLTVDMIRSGDLELPFSLEDVVRARRIALWLQADGRLAKQEEYPLHKGREFWHLVGRFFSINGFYPLPSHTIIRRER